MFFLLLLGIFLAWLFGCKLYEKNWLKGLSVTIAFKERFIYEGDVSALTETVINDKLLPLPALEVRFSTSKSFEFLKDARANTSATDQCYKRDIFSFLFYQKIERTLPFVVHKRGFYRISMADVFGHDYFFHSIYHTDIPQETTLYVYPRQADTRRIALLCQAISGMQLSQNRLYPDPFEFCGIRDYRREDPMHHINWKASARTGTLMVNQFDSTTSISLTLLFDMEDSLILKYEALLEETIRITASLAARLLKNHMSFYVHSNALDAATDSSLSMFLTAEAGKLAELNQKLACIDSSRYTCSAEELLLAEIAQQKRAHTYVFISKNKNDALVESLCGLAAGQNPVLWVFPINTADTAALEPPDVPGVTFLPWEI